MSYVNIAYKSTKKKDTTVVKIECVFNRRSSWFSVADTTDYVLKHEQGHFDIGELCARKMRREVHRHYQKTNLSTNEYLRRVRNKYVRQLNKMQRKYDNGTKFGTLPNRQKAWQDKIVALLISYDEFKHSQLLFAPDGYAGSR